MSADGSNPVSDMVLNQDGVQDNERCVIGSYEYSPSGAISVMWPYMTMSGI